MAPRTIVLFLAGLMTALTCIPGPATAQNQLGYRVLSEQEAARLANNGGTLGIAIAPDQPINSSGMRFRVLRVTATRPGSTSAQAGFKPGDKIIAADGLVFPDLRTFSSYVSSVRPGNRLSVDYIPNGGGPENAQRVAVLVGGAATSGSSAVPPGAQAESSGLSTAAKVAIGVGAAAIFGCYKAGCFSRSKSRSTVGQERPVAR